MVEMKLIRLRELLHPLWWILSYSFPHRGNESSPFKGIATSLILVVKLVAVCRNGNYPIEGIATIFFTISLCLLEHRRNESSPIKGIATDSWIFIFSSFLFIVEMNLPRLMGLYGY